MKIIKLSAVSAKQWSVATVAIGATLLGAGAGLASAQSLSLATSDQPQAPIDYPGLALSAKPPLAEQTEASPDLAAAKPLPLQLPWSVYGDSVGAEPSPTGLNHPACPDSSCLSLSIAAQDLVPLPTTSTSSAVVPLPSTADSVLDLAQAPSGAAPSQADLARAAQNPIASLISVPFQNNTTFGVGDYDRTGNILNIQPVIPTSLGEDWVLINRTIIPVAYRPELAPGVDSAFGIGDITYQGFVSPKKSGSFTWGVGPALVVPTATNDGLGTGKWSIGPSVVGLVSTGPIVTGALMSNVWSFAGDGNRDNVSLLTFQPFFNYNFEKGWYATTSPIVTANWLGTGEKWTVPLGGGFGRVFKIGTQPVNVSLQAYWNVISPEGAGDWTLRSQFTLLFP